MKKYLSKLCFLCLVLVFTSFSCKEESHNLEYNLSVGDVFKQNMVTDMTIVQTVNYQEMVIKMIMDMDCTYQVKDIHDNLYRLSVTYDKIAIEMDMGFSKMSFNSNTTENIATAENINPLLKAMTGKEIEMTMDKKGKIHTVSGFDKLMSAMLNSIDENVDMTTRQQMVSQFSSQFTDEAMQTTFSQTFSFYPENLVEIGDKWKSSTTMKSGEVQLNVDSEMELKSYGKKNAEINYNAKLYTNEGGFFQSVPGTSGIRMYMNGTQSGIIEIDINSGFPTKSELEQNIEGRAEMEGMTIPQKITSKNTTKTIQ